MKNTTKAVLYYIGILAFLFSTSAYASSYDTKSFADYAFLSQYGAIEIARVSDGTGKSVKTSLLNKVRNEIRQAFKRKKLPVVMSNEPADSSAKVLLIQPRLIKYSGGFGSVMGFTAMVAEGDSTEGTGVSLFVRFKDKKLDVELGTVRVSRGGFSKGGNLVKASNAFVEVVQKKIYEEEGKKPLPIPVEYGGYGRSSRGGRRSAPMLISPGANVAVLNLTFNEVTESETAIITDLLRTEIVKLGIGFYNVVDRKYVDQVMTEHTFAATGVTGSEGAAKIGEMLNAQKVITGSLSKVQETYFLTANMIDVQTGKIESAGSGDYKTAEDMKQVVRMVSNQLVRLK